MPCTGNYSLLISPLRLLFLGTRQSIYGQLVLQPRQHEVDQPGPASVLLDSSLGSRWRLGGYSVILQSGVALEFSSNPNFGALGPPEARRSRI